jgi:predicted amidophosphoribosyltransferase
VEEYFDLAFPGIRISESRIDQQNILLCRWTFFVDAEDDSLVRKIVKYCKILQGRVFIIDDLDQSFALSMHMLNQYERTELGDVVNQAKDYYNQGMNRQRKAAADTLASQMSDFISSHPLYDNAKLIAAIPPSKHNPKRFNLPLYLCQQAASSTGKSLIEIKKLRATPPSKDYVTAQEKLNSIRGAFLADRAVCAGQPVIILDDIYQTGATMSEVAATLRRAGAKQVLGLVATKTLRDGQVREFL